MCDLPNHRPPLEALANQIFDSGDSPNCRPDNVLNIGAGGTLQPTDFWSARSYEKWPICPEIAQVSPQALSRRQHVTIRPPADRGFGALRRATRAAVVIPAVFAFACASTRLSDGDDIGGLVALGTLVSSTTWYAVAVMLAVGFVISFSRVLGGCVAAANPGMLLSFVIAVTIPAPGAVIPRIDGAQSIQGPKTCLRPLTQKSAWSALARLEPRRALP